MGGRDLKGVPFQPSWLAVAHPKAWLCSGEGMQPLPRQAGATQHSCSIPAGAALYAGFWGIFHAFPLLSHSPAIWWVAPGAPAERGVTSVTAGVGKWDMEQDRLAGPHPGSSAPLSPWQEYFPARAKKTHLPTQPVLTMQTLIIFPSPIKG